MTLTIHALGQPAPQGSKRHVGRGILVESSKKLPAWRDAVTTAAHQAHLEHADNEPEPFTGPTRVTIEFRFHRPAAHYGTGRNAGALKAAAAALPCTRATPDLDKLSRGVLDALTTAGVLIDDAQVAQLTARKVYVERGDWTGATITVAAATKLDVPAAVSRAGVS